VGYKQKGIEFERDERYSGSSKFTISKLFQLAYNGIYSFSHFPIRLLTSLGILVICIACIYTAYILYVKFHNPHIPQGFATLAIAIFLFGGVQLVAMGIIGEYVLRIYDETRGRPLFLIKEKYF
jgi:polyisoprenyl-phosphate glycosyltransferase